MLKKALENGLNIKKIAELFNINQSTLRKKLNGDRDSSDITKILEYIRDFIKLNDYYFRNGKNPFETAYKPSKIKKYRNLIPDDTNQIKEEIIYRKTLERIDESINCNYLNPNFQDIFLSVLDSTIKRNLMADRMFDKDKKVAKLSKDDTIDYIKRTANLLINKFTLNHKEINKIFKTYTLVEKVNKKLLKYGCNMQVISYIYFNLNDCKFEMSKYICGKNCFVEDYDDTSILLVDQNKILDLKDLTFKEKDLSDLINDPYHSKGYAMYSVSGDITYTKNELFDDIMLFDDLNCDAMLKKITKDYNLDLELNGSNEKYTVSCNEPNKNFFFYVDLLNSFKDEYRNSDIVYIDKSHFENRYKLIFFNKDKVIKYIEGIANKLIKDVNNGDYKTLNKLKNK